MNNKISLTARDREIVPALLHKVPAHSESVLALWWPDTDDPITSADDTPAARELAAPNSPGALPD
jgi:hypothetical protein